MDKHEKTIAELEAPVVDMAIDYNEIDTSTEEKYSRGRVHVQSRAMMPEK